MPESAETDRILFYDGGCGLCHGTVRWVARWGRTGNGLRFAALQGVTAARLRAVHPGLRPDAPEVAYLEGGRLFWGPAALVALARHLRYPARLLGVVGWLPGWLSGWGYRWVAAQRRRWVSPPGTLCALPGPEFRGRQLE